MVADAGYRFPFVETFDLCGMVKPHENRNNIKRTPFGDANRTKDKRKGFVSIP